MSKDLEEGKVIEIADNIDVNAVSEEIPEGKDKVTKDDEDFENFKSLYKGLIDDKCSEEYGSCDDEKLWDDIAKELYLNSKYYIPNEQELKPEKIEENKKLEEQLGSEEYIIYRERPNNKPLYVNSYDTETEDKAQAIKFPTPEEAESYRKELDVKDISKYKVGLCENEKLEDANQDYKVIKVDGMTDAWKVVKYKNKYYQLSNSEFERFKEDPDDFLANIMIDSYRTLKSLIDATQNDSILKSVTYKENKKLEEDSYNRGIFNEIENALVDAGFDVVRYSDIGALTRNIGWEVSKDEERTQLDCPGSWYDEDLEENKKVTENISPLTDEEKTNYYYGTVKSSIPYNVYKIDDKFYDGNGLEIDKKEIETLKFFKESKLTESTPREEKVESLINEIVSKLNYVTNLVHDMSVAEDLDAIKNKKESAKKWEGFLNVVEDCKDNLAHGISEAVHTERYSENKEIMTESRDRAAETLGKFIYDLGDEAWSYEGERKTSMGRTLYVVSRNGKAKLNQFDVDEAINKEYPELFPIVIQDDKLVYEKKKAKKEAKALKEEKEPEQTLEDLVDFLNANDIKRDNIEDNQEKVEKYLADEHLGMTQYIPGVFAIAQFDGEDRKKIGRIVYYSGKNGGWGFHRDTFALESKELNEAKIDKTKLADIYNRLMDIDEELQDLESEGITIKDNSGHTIADNLVLVINPLLDFMENNEDIDDITPELHYKKGGLEFYESKKLNEEAGTFQDYLAYCKDLNLDKNKPATLNKYLKEFGKYVAAIYGLKDYDTKMTDAKKDIKANLNEEKSYEYIDSHEALDDSDLMELIAAIYDKLDIEIDETYDNVIEDIDNENIFFQNIDGKKVLTFDNGDKIAYCIGRDSANIPIVEIDIDDTEDIEELEENKKCEDKEDINQNVMEVVNAEVRDNKESGLLGKEQFIANCMTRYSERVNKRILDKEEKTNIKDYAEDAYSELEKSLNENKQCMKEDLIPVEDLPDMCYGVLPSDCSIIIIKKYTKGYWRTNKDYEKEYEDIEDWNAKMDAADEVADRLNAEIGVTPDERRQMEARSINGNW